MRPQIYKYKPKRTVWIDFKTGRGVTDDGTTVRPKIGDRRKNPNLVDILDTAHTLGAERIMLSGAVPEVIPGKSHWLIVPTPGWTSDGHWFNQPVAGRFTNDVSGAKLEVRTVSEWFGTNDLRPAEARDAWTVTAAALADAVPGALMGLTPAATGTNAWALSLPKTVGSERRPLELEPLPADVAAELHATSGQHRIEHLTTGPDRCGCGACLPLFDAEATPKLEVFSYIDGRFMYAALCRELGLGFRGRLNRAGAAELLERDPYARARFYVRATVPATWSHVGLLAVQHADAADGWHYPNRPGTTFEAWADAAEIKIARDNGWMVEPVEAIEFYKSRPLDTFAERMTRARSRVDANHDLSGVVRRAAAGALRSIVIQTIGNFAKRFRGRTVAVDSAHKIPEAYVDTAQRYGDAWTYTEPGREHRGNELAIYQPQIAVQVWARSRSRVLWAPTANTSATGERGGVLAMDPGTLLGINGDAIYTTDIPAYALPAGGHGTVPGGDDGKVGRLRMKGILENVPTPTTQAERNELRVAAEATPLPWEVDL